MANNTDSPHARGAVREADIARRLMHYAVTKRSLPKHVDSRLLTVRDPRDSVYTKEQLLEMQKKITDRDYRIFVDAEQIHVFNKERFVSGRDITEIFLALDVEEGTHAFYLGKELQKASIALRLGKRFRQEGELAFGYVTEGDEEKAPQESRARAARERTDRTRAARKRSSR